MDNKNELRKQMRIIRDKLLDSEVSDYSKAIYDNLMATGLFGKSKLVLLYASVNNEPDMFFMHDTIKENCAGIKIGYPLVCDDRKHMNYYFVNDYNMELKKGYMNIKEPDKTITEQVDLKEYLDNNNQIVVIIPGLVFDKYGNRMGYGGGYYDRFLAEYAGNDSVIKIAVCYEFQVCDYEICHEAHDIVMDYVITEKKVYRISGKGGALYGT